MIASFALYIGWLMPCKHYCQLLVSNFSFYHLADARIDKNKPLDIDSDMFAG